MDEKSWGTRSWQEAHFPAEQLDSDGDAWGIRWRGVEKYRHRLYLRNLKYVLRRDSSLNVLDIGCALCDFTKKAWHLNESNKIFALDTSETAIAWASKKFTEFQFRVATLPTIPFEQRFDVVMCLEVLCYLDDDGRDASIERIYEALWPGGRLVFSGVLDGGVRHHTKEEILGRVGRKFEIEKVKYHHWWLHRRFEAALVSVDSALRMLSEKQQMSKGDFHDWCQGGRSRSQLIIAKTVRLLGPVSRVSIRAIQKTIKWLLSVETPAVIGDALSKLFFGESKAGEIFVIARKS